jgi:hypothetical protein
VLSLVLEPRSSENFTPELRLFSHSVDETRTSNSEDRFEGASSTAFPIPSNVRPLRTVEEDQGGEVLPDLMASISVVHVRPMAKELECEHQRVISL